MRIEDHWHDGVEYYISFETTNGRTIRKHLILFEDLTDVEIKSIVSERFNAVKTMSLGGIPYFSESSDASFVLDRSS